MEEIKEPTKVVILANFSKEEVFSVMRSVKNQMGSGSDIAFAMATPHSLEMKLKDIVKDVGEEHAYFKHKKTQDS